MIKAVIFDFDGVILESSDIKTAAFRKLFQDLQPFVIDEIVDYHVKNSGISRYVKFKYIYENILKLPFSSELSRELGIKFSDLVFKEVLAVSFVPGALEFLQAFYTSYNFYVASGTPQDELLTIIQERKISKYFKGIYGSPKTKYQIIGEILKSLALTPGEAVLIGDGESDFIAAEKSGIHFIARIYSDHDKLSKCVYKTNDLSNLKNIIDSIN